MNSQILIDLIPGIICFTLLVEIYVLQTESFKVKNMNENGIVGKSISMFSSYLVSLFQGIIKRKNKVTTNVFITCSLLTCISLCMFVYSFDGAYEKSEIYLLCGWIVLLFTFRYLCREVGVIIRGDENLLNTLILFAIGVSQITYSLIEDSNNNLINILSWLVIVVSISFYVKDIHSSLKGSFLTRYVGGFYIISIFIFTEIYLSRVSLISLSTVNIENLIMTSIITILFCYFCEKLIVINESIKSKSMLKTYLFCSTFIIMLRTFVWII